MYSKYFNEVIHDVQLNDYIDKILGLHDHQCNRFRCWQLTCFHSCSSCRLSSSAPDSLALVSSALDSVFNCSSCSICFFFFTKKKTNSYNGFMYFYTNYTQKLSNFLQVNQSLFLCLLTFNNMSKNN